MREKTIVALYDHYSDARAATAAVVQAGAAASRIAPSGQRFPTAITLPLSINPAYAREQVR